MITINGRPHTADIPPRTHLADLLRDTLRLTGTHLGCEHGVCGACTILLDGEPARACLAYPALLDGAEIRTIEDLADDPVVARLRDAFAAAHALQCGYCTPGMLVTARDIVLRLPDADDDRIRLELAGNLCRCTGYDGIVRAIRSVLEERLDFPPLARFPVPTTSFGDAAPSAQTAPAPAQPGLDQRLSFPVSAAVLYAALRDPARVAICIPGAILDHLDGDHLSGTLQVALGPIRVRFAGQADLAYDDATHSGSITGAGADRGGTRVHATARFQVQPDGPASSVLLVTVDYTLRGALAQLARGRIVDQVAGEFAAQFARALAASLTGSPSPSPEPIRLLSLLWRLLRRWF